MKNSAEYRGLDVVWLAVDRLGQVAAFTTAGEGDIPDSAMIHIGKSEELILSLPEISRVEVDAAYKRSDDFFSFAQRGFFAYDWSDAHRIASRRLGGYELVTRPVSPILLMALPIEVAEAVGLTVFQDVTFGEKVLLEGWK
ncbi:hypothetical protein [Dyella sp. 2HG41-7]|uniref:hypothetical protein n=1 Tax=Dyella sp. 2HG41-7 TaxID=2883239 RepID=UPI001F384025|nr:hypothetical protein [Dyella sp. 2HG41-7]